MALLVSFSLLIRQGTAQEHKKDQIQKKLETAAVLDFSAISGISKEEAASLTSKFRNAFANTKKYTVLEVGEMKEILKAQDFTLSDNCKSAECAVQVGQLLATEKIVSGDIGKIGSTYSVTIKIIDVTSGRIEKTLNEEYSGKPDGLLSLLDAMAQKVTGTYKAGKTWMYIAGGLTGGGILAWILLKPGSSSPSASGELPLPPSFGF